MNKADALLSMLRTQPEERDKEGLLIQINRFLERNWPDADIISYMNCTEEINPDLEEDEALRRMSIIFHRNKNA